MKRFYLFLVTTVFLFTETKSQLVDEHEECLAETDLILVLDGSKSVTKPNFNLVKEWVKRLAEGMHIGHGHIQIGVVQYSYFYRNKPLNQQRYIKTEIGLGQYMDKARFDVAVDRIRYQGYQTYTAHALNKTLNIDFLSKNNRYPKAKRALILMTDGNANDAAELPPVVKLAKSMGVVMYAVGVGEYNINQLQLITGNRSNHIFELSNFDDLHAIISDLQYKIRTVCDCDVDGSISTECDACTQKCDCRENVVGRRCDACATGFYGISSGQGCTECECNDFGSTNTSQCDGLSGQCVCRPGSIAGRQCDQCAEGYFGFPECRPCDCNGFSVSCNEITGVCTDCAGGRIGDHCQSCEVGHFWDGGNGYCLPCECNNNINASDPTACDEKSGRCLKCLHHTTGKNCETCLPYYYGDATIQTCTKCACNMEGVDKSECDGENCNCAPDGMCKCLPNVEGGACDQCVRNTFGLGDPNGCKECECNFNGTVENTTCDVISGQCECTKGYNGINCDDCAEGFDRIDSGDNLCIELAGLRRGDREPTPPDDEGLKSSPLSTTVLVTETKLATTARPKMTKSPKKTKPPRRINPGWSPCVSCGGGRYSLPTWPSYCHGWTCRRRWPHHVQLPSPHRCHAGSWVCQASARSHYGHNNKPTYRSNHYGRYNTPSYGSNYYGYWNAPSYYRGYHHHSVNHRRRSNYYHPPVRYSLYASKK